MGRVWVFGSCFSWGFGCKEYFPYCKQYKKDGDKIWTEIVSENLGLDVVDKSIPAGATNFTILKSFIENFSKIKEGDIVIYEIMKPLGLLKLNNMKTKVDSISTYNLHLDKHWRDSEDKRISNEYIDLNVRGHDEVWVKWFYPQIKSISDVLLEKNIKTYLWYYHVWELYSENRFENIIDATNGDIDDFHYSFEGHRQMANYILDIISKDKYLKEKNII